MTDNHKHDKQKHVEHTQSIVELLEDLLDKDYWEHSSYLQDAKKRLSTIQDDAKNFLCELDNCAKPEEE
jgi:hypothetical protein